MGVAVAEYVRRTCAGFYVWEAVRREWRGSTAEAAEARAGRKMQRGMRAWQARKEV